jgi:hypothetical protein
MSAVVNVDDYQYPAGWAEPAWREGRARWYCEQLEQSRILYFPDFPYAMPEDDLQFMLAQRMSGSKTHKNISYRPQEDVMRGFAPQRPEDVPRMHGIMRDYSARVTQFLREFLIPYADEWAMDFASFRPLEEQGRDLSLHKRNDLLHVDAFPSRPTKGGRILRVFSNINPQQPRIWLTTGPFEALAAEYAQDAGLQEIAAQTKSSKGPLKGLMRAVGMKVPDRSAYDEFMLRFHDYLKENSDFQTNHEKTRTEFPPRATWMVFTDAVAHAALSGQYALEQTYIVPVDAMLLPAKSPLRVLEALAGQPLTG